MIPLWVQAGFWGLVAGSALIIGTLMAYYMHIPQRLIAVIMSFGSGVLISALAFELMNKAYQQGGFGSITIGFLSGAIVYTAANTYLSLRGAKHRKRSGSKQPSEKETSGSGLAIAVGSLLDDIPESIAIGVSMIQGGTVGIVTVVAIFLSNIPEGLSSTAGMKKAGRSALYIFGIWGGIAVITGISSLIGYTVFSHFSVFVISMTLAVAAGAILSMLADTMMPEAFSLEQNYAGLVTVLGFLVAFALSKLSA